jgi:hypothetical protein
MSEETVLKAEVSNSAEKPSKLAGSLIIAGLLLLALNLLDIHLMNYLWPMFILGLGALMVWPAYKSTADEQSKLNFLAVPGAMVLALGVLLFLLNLVNHYESMAYSWTLLLAAGGAGYGYLHRFDESGNKVDKAHRFVRTMVLLFMGLATFFELFIFQSLGAWWPVLIVGLGIYMLVKNKRSETQ